MIATRGLLLVSLITLALGKPTARIMKLHESRVSIPDGFSLRGAAEPESTIKLRLALVQSNFAELERRLMDVSTPSSPNYGNHLSKAEVRNPSPARTTGALTTQSTGSTARCPEAGECRCGECVVGRKRHQREDNVRNW